MTEPFPLHPRVEDLEQADDATKAGPFFPDRYW